MGGRKFLGFSKVAIVGESRFWTLLFEEIAPKIRCVNEIE